MLVQALLFVAPTLGLNCELCCDTAYGPTLNSQLCLSDECQSVCNPSRMIPGDYMRSDMDGEYGEDDPDWRAVSDLERLVRAVEALEARSLEAPRFADDWDMEPRFADDWDMEPRFVDEWDMEPRFADDEVAWPEARASYRTAALLADVNKLSKGEQAVKHAQEAKHLYKNAGYYGAKDVKIAEGGVGWTKKNGNYNKNVQHPWGEFNPNAPVKIGPKPKPQGNPQKVIYGNGVQQKSGGAANNVVQQPKRPVVVPAGNGGKAAAYAGGVGAALTGAALAYDQVANNGNQPKKPVQKDEEPKGEDLMRAVFENDGYMRAVFDNLEDMM